MSVFATSAREKADRIAAAVGGAAFIIGIIFMALGAGAPTGDIPTAISTTVASSPIPGDPVTMTTLSTEPPTRPTNAPRVTQEVTVTEGTGPGTLVVTTSPAVAEQPFLGSTVAVVLVQFVLVTFAALFLAFATQRMLLGEYGLRRPGLAGAGRYAVGEDEAAGIKQDVGDAREKPDLSRPLYERSGVTDARLRLLQSRIALELEVRKLAQDHDLPSGLSVPYVVKGLVEKNKMTEKLGSAITSLNAIGDRLGRGAEISPDTTTMLTDSYAQALAKVGGRIK